MKKTILSRAKTWPVLAAFVFMMLTIPSRAEDPTSIQPPEIELFAATGFYQWLETNPYLEKLSTTAFWEDLKLSDQFLGLASLRHRLENQLGLAVSKSLIKEFMSAPMELSLWNAFNEQTDTVFVMSLEINPTLQGLVKLMEIYAKNTNKLNPIKTNNLEIHQTQWGKKPLFHLLLKNQLLLSNNQDYLITMCGKGNPGKRFRDSTFFKKYLHSHPGNVKCRLDLMALLKNFKAPLEKNTMFLGIAMDLGQTVRFHALTITPDPPLLTKQTVTLADCKNVIPVSPIWTYVGVYPAHYYIKMIEGLPGFAAKNETTRLNVAKDVMPFFNNRFFVYFSQFQDQEHPNVFDGLMGFSLNPFNKTQRDKLIAFTRMVITKKDMGMRLEAEKGELPVYRYDEENRPAFCITENWLLIGTTYYELKESLAVLTKKKSAISDSPAYRAMEPMFSKKSYCQILINPAQFFQTFGRHLAFVAQAADNFNALDIKNKILPAFDILGQIPAFGLFLEKKDKNLHGNITFEKE